MGTLKYPILFVMKLFLIFGTTSMDESNWLNHMCNYIEETSFYQATIITESKSRIPQTQLISQKISTKIPSVHLSHCKEIQFNEQGLYIHLQYPYNVTLLASYFHCCLPDQFETLRIIRHHNKLTTKRVIVIIHENEPRNSEFIKNLFSSECSGIYFDTTVVELTRRAESNNISTLRNNTDLLDYNARIHQYNPFTGVYSIEPFSTKIEWFPMFCRDLNGTEVFTDPTAFKYPFIGIKENVIKNWYKHTSKELVGPHSNILATLENVMNFTLRAGINTRRKDKPCHISLKMAYEPNFLYSDSGYPTSVFFMPSKTIPLFPIMYTYKIIVPEHFGLYIISALSIVVILKVVARLLNWERRLWTYSLICSGILGSSVPRMPHKTVERIAYTSVLLISVVFGVNVMSGSIDFHLFFDIEDRFATLQELYRASYRLQINNIERFYYSHTNLPILKKFVDTANVDRTNTLRKFIKDITINGVERAMALENEYVAKVVSKLYSHMDKKLVFSCMPDQHIMLLWEVVMVQTNLPLLPCINSILSRLRNSGLIVHWYKTRMILAHQTEKYGKTHWIKPKKIITKPIRAQLFTKLFIYLCFSFSFCAFVFLGEIIFWRFYNHVYHYTMRLKYVRLILKWWIYGKNFSRKYLRSRYLETE